MSAIDREKALQWGRERLNQLKKKNDVLITRDYVDGYIDAFEEWLRELQSGAFDVREPIKPFQQKLVDLTIQENAKMYQKEDDGNVRR